MRLLGRDKVRSPEQEYIPRGEARRFRRKFTPTPAPDPGTQKIVALGLFGISAAGLLIFGSILIAMIVVIIAAVSELLGF